MRMIGVALVALMVSGPALAAGIPVFDAISAANFVKQIAEVQKQLTTMQQQLVEARRMYDSVTGNRGVGSLLNSPLVSTALPSDIRSLYYAASSASYGSITGPLERVLRSEQFTGTTAEGHAHVEARDRQARAQRKAVAEVAYDKMQSDLVEIDRLTTEISRTQDAKGIAELQALIAAKQAAITNEQTKLQLIAQMQDAERDLIDQQKRDMSRRILSSQNTYVPSID